ncbi:hypothetical protein [Thermophilibacter sp.]
MTDNTTARGRDGSDSILAFLDGGAPPVFEEYGTDALEAGTLRCDEGREGPVSYDAPDAGTFDLTTPQGRKAWACNAPKGVERTIPEDGEAWANAVADGARAEALAWLADWGIA